MNKFSDYKETNSDWIGSIPTEWRLIRGRFLFNSKKELNHDLQCENLLSLTLSGVLNKDYHSNDGLRPENYNSFQIFEKNDLVFKMIDLENVNTSRVGIVPEEGIMSPVYLRHEPIKNKIDPKFAYWFYYDLYKKEIYNSIGSGVRASLSSSDLLEIQLPVPPIIEQKRISLYLNKKTKQIDRLVLKIQKKIELLREQRVSQINHYVTKGLNPNVDMKDSGVEWIGEIPKHWDCKKLKFVSKQISEKRLPAQGDIKISPENVESESGKIINFYSEYDTEGQIFSTGDILFNKLRVYLNKVVLCDFSGLSMGEMIVIRPKQIFGPFLHRILNSAGFIDHVNSLANGVKVPRPPVDGIFNSSIPFPPESEQIEIFKHLDTDLKKIDYLIEKHMDQINLVTEYRQSLISSVVTGKLRVTEELI
jgi:type I restriction enzyme, S subunit